MKEAEEEASLPADLVRHQAVATGAVSYFYVREESAGGEVGLLQPEVQYVYDLAVPEEVVPKPNDDEVDSFSLMPLHEVYPMKYELRVGSRTACSGRLQAELCAGFIRLLCAARYSDRRQRKGLPPNRRARSNRPPFPSPIRCNLDDVH